MKTEDKAWNSLFMQGASRIRPGFPDRVLRATRAYTSSPLFVSQFAMCAATAAVCLLAVALYNNRSSVEEDSRSLASWNDVADQAGELDTSL